jgi:hypothetical protein
MRVLVCGGRSFSNQALLDSILKLLHERHPITLLIHGGANGADTLAGRWAALHKVPVKTYLPNWEVEGKRAGVFRNRRMLVDGQPNLVVALPGGRGTENMILQALKAGVRIVRVTDSGLEEV